MNRGDSFNLYLDYQLNDVPLAPSENIEDIEFTISSNGSCCCEDTSDKVQFYLSKNEIIYDDEQQMYYARLTQSQSFKFGRNISYQMRIMFTNGDVYSSNEERAFIGDTLSDVELGE